MAYIKPAPLIYQDLVNSGGVLNSTPDLEACIIGPVYNKLEYIPGSVPSQVKTAAYATSSTTGAISATSVALTVVSTAGFLVGDSILVIGAGDSSGSLQATITDITGNVITLDTAAGTTVTEASVTKAAKIVDSTIANTFKIPGAKPGQVIEPSSIKVWLNNSRVETLVTSAEGYYTDNTVSVLSLSTTGTISSGSNSLTVAAVTGFVKGDYVTVAGAGVAGATLTAKITDITGSVLTVTPAASTAVTSQAVTKAAVSNVNSVTNTLRAEPGDTVVLSYVNTSAVAKVVTSQIKSLVTSSGQNGNVSSIDLVDMLPSDLSVQTTGSIPSGSPTLTVASATGISTGKKVLVRGAGTAGADLVASVTGVSGTSITLDINAGTTVASSQVIVFGNVAVSIRKTYNDQQLPLTKPISGGANYDTSNAGTLATVQVNAAPELSYGPVISGDVYMGYRALRTDLSNRVLTINDVNDLEGQLGEISDDNPLALAIQIALANTTGRIRAIAVDSNDLTGYLAALEVAEGERLYYLCPLTQDLTIITAFKAHVSQLSTPEGAAWRVAIVNSEIPTEQDIGPWSADFVNSNSGNNAITLVAGKYVLTASNATFLSDGATPGDILHITAATPSGAIGSYEIQEVVSNQQVVITASTTATAVSYYVTRALSKTQSAQAVAATSRNLGLNRVWHIMPDIVGVSVGGVTKYLPGYYLCAGLAGMGAGFPVQQGFTNIGVAGIVDLKNSNFFFKKTDLDAMAEAGTCLFVQDSQDGIPYVRHELTTDVTVLEYREMLVVKNWDFLSYFYYDKLKGFIGSWNITPDTINTIRQVLEASSTLVKSKKLPKIGAPLLSATIQKLEQDSSNKDTLVVVLQISVVYPLNYLQLHLQI